MTRDPTVAGGGMVVLDHLIDPASDARAALGAAFGTGALGAAGYYFAAPGGSTTGSRPNGALYAHPLFIGRTMTVARIGVDVTTAGSAGALCRLGIYADNGWGLPGTLLLDAGVVDCTTTGVKELTITQALAPGLYWFAAATQGAPTTAPVYRLVSGALQPVGDTSAANVSANALNGYAMTT